MAKLTEKIAQLRPDQRFVSFEFFPPKTDGGFRNLIARLTRMSALNPLFVTVTWGAGGSTSEKSLDLAATCQRELGLTTVLHLTCTNTNRQIIDTALARAKEAGIRNVLALRGDPPRAEEYWTPDCDFHNAVDLVRYIKANYGDYFCVGVAGYPEGHVDGSDNAGQDPRKDMPYLVEKVKAGADFIITQLFYDVDKFLAYEQLLQSYPELKDVVLIPGLMPVTTYKVFQRAAKLSHAKIPAAIEQRVSAHQSNDDTVKQIGVDVITDIIAAIDAKTNGRIRGYHFYCLNLEKATASIIANSQVLSSVIDEPTHINHDEAIASDDSDVEAPPKGANGARRRSSLVNANELAKDDAQRALVNKALLKDKRVLREISAGKGALGKDAIWDDFPNGRFGDSNSPAYGEIDGYGPSLKISTPNEATVLWGTPESTLDITRVFTAYLSGSIPLLPWADQALSPETALIQEELLELNCKGWFSLASQPAVNACRSNDKILGWGPPGGVLYQKAFVELFVPKKDWREVILPRITEDVDAQTITYYLGDSSGKIESNLPRQAESKTAITWGVFPSREVVQPTMVDYESFKAWNEEAFHLWVEWARCYKVNSKSYQLLNSIHRDYYLVSLVHHDYPEEHALWDTLLQE
ncbi:hypothetical protein DIURU_003780 [Diutina rugosa]|uniref:MTHFR SAM-binding regulatory domain-containing protein n=1 Tax=Diutina rugosa TaxID=5481 RepID=A0A642UJK7_DIURU|nr:uncharacterized protein DIURU_003780 [Diutina rugosa]KAA8900357.1 hypothetical protein DIURU_003780 [Diutina rugosa]